VRVATDLDKVFSECPFAEEAEGSGNESEDIFKRKGTANHFLQEMKGYDWVLGTSERGEDVHKELGAMFTNTSKQSSESSDGSQKPPMSFKHGLILFGGLGGLEDVLRDPLFHNPRKIKDPRDLCHHYVNVASTQTSRTIRAEEALMITLAQLSGYLQVHA
jgi:methyltransferase